MVLPLKVLDLLLQNTFLLKFLLGKLTEALCQVLLLKHFLFKGELMLVLDKNLLVFQVLQGLASGLQAHPQLLFILLLGLNALDVIPIDRLLLLKEGTEFREVLCIAR